ncbi:MAG: P-loop NTPase [bacterium]|nr:P-loop NTPase [bacterium]
MERHKTIIPIAGGKGGVGKSLFVANLGLSLAEMGHETVAVDLDLGSSNLHTYLGLPNINPGIGDFLKVKKVNLNDYLMKTCVDNFSFLPGDGKSPFMANIPYAQKLRLIREIKKIDARYILVDLGAGSTFNTLDFFGMANSGIIISTFEYSAIMNVLMFLKNFILRKMRQISHSSRAATTLIDQLCKEINPEQPLTTKYVISKIEEIDREVAGEIREFCSDFRPRLVFNMGENPEELKVLDNLHATILERLSLDTEYIGFLFSDSSVKKSVKEKVPLLINYSDSLAAEGIKSVANRIIKYWDNPIENSIEKLMAATQRTYDDKFIESYDISLAG